MPKFSILHGGHLPCIPLSSKGGWRMIVVADVEEVLGEVCQDS